MRMLLLGLSLLMMTIVNAQQTYLHCGKLVDVKSGKVLKEQTIIVEGNVIVDVQKGYLNPRSKDIQLVDLKKKTVMPGFIDMHIHIEGETGPNKYLEPFTLNDADVAYNAAEIAERTLMAGFTTVRDLGGSGVNVSLKKAIARGKVRGPRVLTAEKALGTTGGHADPTNGYRKELMGDPGPKEGVVNGVDDARKAVRQRYKNGADWIKITATGGVLSVAKNGQNPQFTAEEILAITTTAKEYGMQVAAHAHGDEGMKRAVKNGVKTIEHGTLMSEETMELMKKENAYYVPTISAGKYVAEKAKVKGFYPEIIVPKALEIGPQIQNTFKKAYKKGVSIAFGTDAGVFPHGENGKEFGYMVEAGMPEMEAIQSATITNAKVLEMERLGQLSKGFLADIVASDDDPTKNIKTLESISFVMKNGKIYKN